MDTHVLIRVRIFFCFHPSEAFLLTIGSTLSRLWKHPFHPLEVIFPRTRTDIVMMRFLFHHYRFGGVVGIDDNLDAFLACFHGDALEIVARHFVWDAVFRLDALDFCRTGAFASGHDDHLAFAYFKSFLQHEAFFS